MPCVRIPTDAYFISNMMMYPKAQRQVAQGVHSYPAVFDYVSQIPNNLIISMPKWVTICRSGIWVRTLAPCWIFSQSMVGGNTPRIQKPPLLTQSIGVQRACHQGLLVALGEYPA